MAVLDFGLWATHGQPPTSLDLVRHVRCSAGDSNGFGSGQQPRLLLCHPF